MPKIHCAAKNKKQTKNIIKNTIIKKLCTKLQKIP